MFVVQSTFLITLLTFALVTFLPNIEASLYWEIYSKLSIGFGVSVSQSDVLPNPGFGDVVLANPKKA